MKILKVSEGTPSFLMQPLSKLDSNLIASNSTHETIVRKLVKSIQNENKRGQPLLSFKFQLNQTR